MTAGRQARVERKTKETEIAIQLGLDGTGASKVATPIPFFSHMLEAFSKHGLIDLAVEAHGDIEVDQHHTVEDVGIVLGQALDAALGDRSGIRRFGSAAIPMDEALGVCAVDVSGRPLCVFQSGLPLTSIAGFDTESTEEFFRAVATNAKLTVHIGNRYGANPHHMVEACFKAFARALRDAVSIDPDESGVPSTKGTLT